MKTYMRYLALLALLLFTCACTSDRAPETAATSSSEDLMEILAEYNESRLQLMPMEATFQGDSRYNDYLPNMLTADYRDQLRSFYQRAADDLDRIDRSDLNADEKVSYDVLRWETDINREALSFREDLLPLDQFNGFHLMIGQLASGQSAQPFKTVADYDNWRSRAADFTDMLDTAIVRMQEGVAQGYVLPSYAA